VFSKKFDSQIENGNLTPVCGMTFGALDKLTRYMEKVYSATDEQYFLIIDEGGVHFMELLRKIIREPYCAGFVIIEATPLTVSPDISWVFRSDSIQVFKLKST